MKLWPTTTENKNNSIFGLFNMHFFFFFQTSICALFSYISINYIKSDYATTMFCLIQRFSLFIYSAILVCHFVFFFSFEQWLQYHMGTIWHCSYSSYIYIFWVYHLFFFLLYILLHWHNKFHNIFTIIDVLICYKSK